MLAPVYNVTFFFHFEITFHCDQFLMCVVVGQPGYVVLHELCVCGFWSTQKENEKYGNEVGTLTSTTTSIFLISCFFWVPTQRRDDANSWPEYHYIKMYRNEVIIVVLQSSEIKRNMLDEIFLQNALFFHFHVYFSFFFC